MKAGIGMKKTAIYGKGNIGNSAAVSSRSGGGHSQGPGCDANRL